MRASPSGSVNNVPRVALSSAARYFSDVSKRRSSTSVILISHRETALPRSPDESQAVSEESLPRTCCRDRRRFFSRPESRATIFNRAPWTCLGKKDFSLCLFHYFTTIDDYRLVLQLGARIPVVYTASLLWSIIIALHSFDDDLNQWAAREFARCSLCPSQIDPYWSRDRRSIGLLTVTNNADWRCEI